jgi:hypothetical protein
VLDDNSESLKQPEVESQRALYRMTKALNSQSAQRPAVNFVWMEIETFNAIGDSHNPSITLAGAGPRLGMGK